MDEFLSLLGEEIGSRPQNQLEDWWKTNRRMESKKMLGFRPHFWRHQTTASDGAVYRITKAKLMWHRM